MDTPNPSNATKEVYLSESFSARLAKQESTSPDELGTAQRSLEDHQIDVVTEIPFWSPPGVVALEGFGSRFYVGLLEDGNVLKYRHQQSDSNTELELEAKIYEALGPHPYIVPCLGWYEDGLRFPLRKEIIDRSDDADAAQRATWVTQCAKALAHVHEKGILHCDIQPRNVLLDDNDNIQLCDFQGVYEGASGRAMEDFEYSLPEPLDDAFQPSVRRDIFALGSLIFWIMTGKHPYHGLASASIEERFKQRLWPPTDFKFGNLVVKCWEQEYGDAEQLVSDLEFAKTKAERARLPR